MTISARSRSLHRLGRDAVEQLAPLSTFQHGRLAGLHHVLWPADRMRRIGRHDLAGDQPVGADPAFMSPHAKWRAGLVKGTAGALVPVGL
jgi:hypothetical protein